MKQATLVFADQGDSFRSYQDMLRQYSIINGADTQQFINILIDHRPALIFIDAARPDWQPLILTAKTNAATRRIPICLLSDDNQQCAGAISSGADLAISWAELDKQLTTIVQELARIPDPALLAQLDCQCQQELPPLAAQGFEMFNRGEYYQQHDLFEELWMKTEGPVRDLYRAILQIGVAYYQIERGNYRGALKMLQRSVQWLYFLPDTCQTIDVARLRQESYALRAELQRLGPERLDQFDHGLMKKLRRHPPQSPST